MNLTVDLAPGNKQGLKLKNPVMLASGTCGYVSELGNVLDITLPGAFICKGTTLNPRQGNPQPRIAEVEAGMLNAIGLENIGVENLVKNKAPEWHRQGITVLVNIAGSTIEEYTEIAHRLDGVAGISGIELNISCPNVKEGGVEFGLNACTAAEVTRAVRQATTLPLLVKLSPCAGQVSLIAQAVEEAGADALTLINTFKGMVIDIQRRKPLLGNLTGGLSGPVLKPVALAMVYETAGRVGIPVVACGGISNTEDALEFIMAGAATVQCGTAFLVDPGVPAAIISGIEHYMASHEIADIADLRGCALPNSSRQAGQEIV